MIDAGMFMTDDDSNSRKDAKPLSRGKRFVKLAAMTASVAGNYTRSRIKGVFQSEEERAKEIEAAHTANGQLMAQTLGELKGAVMKIGQMASVAKDVLPPEMADALTSLQKDSPPMPFEVIAEQIERELGAHPSMLFDSFEQEPFAAASIGQVHRAVVDDGRPVIVKVQYPGVDESCDSDLNQLKLTLKMSGFINTRSHKKAFDALFEEVRARLHEELDYTIEAEHVRLFRKLHADDDYIVVPDVVGERSAKRVLTLTYEPGDSLEELTEAPYTDEIRDTIGTNLIRMFGAQVFRYKTMHADPNPGNYAFRPDGKIVLYDYGCVKKLSPRVVSIYRDMAEAIYKENYIRLDRMLMLLGARVEGSPDVPEEFYEQWRRILLEPFIKDEVYDYGDSKIVEEAQRHAVGAIKYAHSFQPAPELVFLDRVMVGLHNNFRTFGPRVPWRSLLEEHLAIKQIDYDD